MKKITTRAIGDKEITISELTVGEIDQVLGSMNTAGPMQKTYDVMGYDLSPEFTQMSAGIDAAFHADLLPTELDILVSGVEEVNAVFLERVRKNAEAVVAAQLASQPTREA